MDALWQDIRYALRTLARSPGFTLVGIFVLAIAIGVNTAMFSLVNALIFVKLPVPQARELRFIYAADPNARPGPMLPPMMRELEALRASDLALASLPGYAGDRSTLAENGELLHIRGERVTSNYFDVLRIVPPLGRSFHPDDDRQGAEPVIVFSDAFWKARFLADPAIVGKTLALDQDDRSSYSGLMRAYTIVGVAPPGFSGVANRFQPSSYWVPNTTRIMDGVAADALQGRHSYRGPDPVGGSFIVPFLRKAPTVSDDHITAVVKAAAHRFARERRPDQHAWTLDVTAMKRNALPFDTGGRVIPSRLAAALMIAAGAVVLIALANLGGLLSARGVVRRSEMAVRTTLGASGWRLTRQLLTESLLIAMAGGLLGLAAARAAVQALVAAVPRLTASLTNAPPTVDVPLDWPVLLYTAASCIAAALLVTVAPARHANARDLLEGLSEGQAAHTSRSRSRLRRWVLVPQVCGSLILLVVAAVLVRGILAEEAVDPGYRSEGVALVEFQFEPFFYYRATDEERRAWRERRRHLQQRILEFARSIPGVQAAALAPAPPNGVPLPMMGGTVVERASFTANPGGHGTATARVTSGYFEALRIPLKYGRTFRATDGLEGRKVAVICEGLAWRIWGTPNAVGRYVAERPHGPSPPDWHEVIGVVASAARPLTEGAATSTLYFPIEGSYQQATTILARGEGPSSALLTQMKEAVVKADPANLAARPRLMVESIDAMLFPRRAAAAILGTTGLAGLLLACIGLYGVVSYSVAQRVREIGIRAALGAERRDIMRLILREGIKVTATGTALGGVLAFAAIKLTSAKVVALPQADIITLSLAPFTLALAMLLATYIPARRAASVDPMIALRRL
jgi:putative ABC transport system permease protein